MEEFEVKFLEVSVPELEKKLLGFGAEKTGETVSRITNFDFPDYRLRANKGWVRLRSEFGKTTLAYKQRLGVTSEDGSHNDTGMKEIEIEVSDFDVTSKLLLSIGLMEKFSQERKRLRYKKDDIVFDIDMWPIVPPYLEIEGPSMEKIKKVAEELGFNWEKHVIGSFSQVCQKYGFSDHDYTVFTFKEQVKR